MQDAEAGALHHLLPMAGSVCVKNHAGGNVMANLYAEHAYQIMCHCHPVANASANMLHGAAGEHVHPLYWTCHWPVASFLFHKNQLCSDNGVHGL